MAWHSAGGVPPIVVVVAIVIVIESMIWLEKGVDYDKDYDKRFADRDHRARSQKKKGLSMQATSFSFWRNGREVGRRSYWGGSAIDILSALVGVGLLAYGGWWIFKTMGRAGEQYAEGMITAQNRSTEVVCQMNMRSIWQGLQMAATSEGRYPESKSDLIRWCGDPRLFHCPDPNGGEYRYLPAQPVDGSRVVILLYEPNAVHDGRRSVLLSNGQIGLLTGDEFKRAVSAQPKGRR